MTSGDAFYRHVEESKPHWIGRVEAIEKYVWLFSKGAEVLSPHPTTEVGVDEKASSSVPDITADSYTAVYTHCREPTRCEGRAPIEFMLLNLQCVFTAWADGVLLRAGFDAADSDASPAPHSWDALCWAIDQYCHMRRAMKLMFLYADHNYKNAVQVLFRRCFRTQLQSKSNEQLLEQLLTAECLAAARLQGSESGARVVLETLDDLSLPHVVSSFLDHVTSPLHSITEGEVLRQCKVDPPPGGMVAAVCVYLDNLVASMARFIGTSLTDRAVMHGRFAILVAVVYQAAARGTYFKEVIAADALAAWNTNLNSRHPVLDLCTRDGELIAILLDVIRGAIQGSCETASAAKPNTPPSSSLQDISTGTSLELYHTMADAQRKCRVLVGLIQEEDGDRRWASSLLETRVTQTLTTWMRTNDVICANACAQGLLSLLHAVRDGTDNTLPDEHLTHFSHLACLLAPKDALVDALTVEIASEALLPSVGPTPPWEAYSNLLAQLSPFLCSSLLTTPLALMRDLLVGDGAPQKRYGPLPLHVEPTPPLEGVPPRPLDVTLSALCVARWVNVVHTPLAIKNADLLGYVAPCCSKENAASLVAEASTAERADGRQLQWLLHGGTMMAEMVLHPSWTVPMQFTATPCFVLALSAVFEKGDTPAPLEALSTIVRIPQTLLLTFFRWLEEERLVQVSKDQRAVRISPTPVFKRKLRYLCSTVEMALHHQGAEAARGPPAVPDRVVVARVRHMEAVIMKIMKGAGSMTHDHLLERTLKDMSRVAQVTVAQFKVCVGGLIQREYLKRSEGEKTVYTFCT